MNVLIKDEATWSTREVIGDEISVWDNHWMAFSATTILVRSRIESFCDFLATISLFQLRTKVVDVHQIGWKRTFWRLLSVMYVPFRNLIPSTSFNSSQETFQEEEEANGQSLLTCRWYLDDTDWLLAVSCKQRAVIKRLIAKYWRKKFTTIFYCLFLQIYSRYNQH